MRRPVDRYVDRLLRRRRPKPFAPTQEDIVILRTALNFFLQRELRAAEAAEAQTTPPHLST